MKRFIWFVLFIILSTQVFALEAIPINVTVTKLKLDLLLKVDGSMDVSQEMFETYKINITTGVVLLDLYIAEIKDYINLKIYDLSESPIKEYTETRDLRKLEYSDCAGKYSLLKNRITICSPINKDNILHFNIKYTLLPDTRCPEKERKQQTFSYQYPLQNEPYTIEVTTRADKGLNYLGPINCPNESRRWENFYIENGLLCKIEDISFPKDSDQKLALTLNGSITGERLDILEQKEKTKNKIKDIILKILVFLNFIAILLGIQYGEQIKNFYNQSRTNKLIIIAIILIVLILYTLFLLW